MYELGTRGSHSGPQASMKYGKGACEYNSIINSLTLLYLDINPFN